MYEDSEDSYIDTSGYQDIESLNESDREELENALYSQIHFEENPDPGCSTVEQTCTFQNYFPIKLEEDVDLNTGIVNLSSKVVDESQNCQSNEHCDTDRKKKVENLNEWRENITKSGPLEQEVNDGNNTLRSLKNLGIKQSKLSRKKAERHQVVKNGQCKTDLNLSIDGDDKKESKYSVGHNGRRNNGINIDRSKLVNYLRNSGRLIQDRNGKRKGTVKVMSDTDSDEEDSDTVVICDSDQSDSDLSGSQLDSESDSYSDSDSDTDSSSMCEKVFTSDKRKMDANIKLNIGKSCDVDEFNISSSDSNSSDSLPSDDDDKWRVSERDLLGSVPERLRYYKYNAVKNVTCKNCREKGHLSKNCLKAKVVVCYLCGDRDHSSRNCNRLTCNICSQLGHSAGQCREKGYKWYNSCSRCDMPGHVAQYCPDLWRRYHLTTTRGDLVKQPVNKNSRVSCCNCGSRKHFGFECNQPSMSSHKLKTYPFIVSYDGLPEEDNPQKRKKSTKIYFDDDDDIEEKYLPLYKKKKIQLISSKNNERKGKKKVEAKSSSYVPVDPLKNFKNVMKSYKKKEEEKKRTERKVRRNAKIDKNFEKLLQQQYISINSISNSLNNNNGSVFDYIDNKPKGKKYKKDMKSRKRVYDGKKSLQKSAGSKKKNLKFGKKRKSIC